MESYQKNAELNLVTMKKADENMEHKVKIIGKLVMVGYGLLVASRFCKQVTPFVRQYFV